MLEFPEQELVFSLLEGLQLGEGSRGHLGDLWAQGKTLAVAEGERRPPTENAFLNLRYLP